MRVFISCATEDANLAMQLEAALRRNGIETRSSLDFASGEDWKRIVDRESASADGFVFLLGAGASRNPQLQAEWRWLLRNDWESKKPLIPVIHAHDASLQDLPPFLRSRRAIVTTNFDTAIDGSHARATVESGVGETSQRIGGFCLIAQRRERGR